MPGQPDSHPASLRFFFPVLKGIAGLLFCLLTAPIRPRERKNVPRTGALLVFSNHLSNTDPIVVQYSCPRLINFMARKELFEMRFLGPFIKWFRAFPVKQSSADKGAIRTALEHLKAGHAVGVFPEGQLSPDGKLIELLPGSALLVRMSGAPCICVGIQDSNKLMPDPQVVPKPSFTSIKATWGTVMNFDRSTTQEEIMDWIRSELLRLSGQPNVT